MPVDRDLAAESLKSIDQKVYEIYVKLRGEGMTEREIKGDLTTFYKLHLFLLGMGVLNEMERKGEIEIFNDYQNRRVVLRKLHDYGKRRYFE